MYPALVYCKNKANLRQKSIELCLYLNYVIVYDNIAIRGGLIMSKAGLSFEKMKADLLKDEEFKAEYEKLRPRYEAVEQIIKARKEQNLTQSELAKRVGTQKSNISRLESGNYNPSLDFLTKVAESLGKNLSIQIR